jgi:ATP-dependent Clp protease ATP-binding subunit ClpC
MLDRLGQEARTAVSLAGEEAYRFGHPYIGTEHLLLGLLAESGTPASEALAAAGASFVSVRQKVVEALASRTTESPPVASRDLAFTNRASRALDRAAKLSARMGSDDVQCEHLLLSVLDVEGTAGQVLRGLWIDPDAVRDALASLTSDVPGSDGRSAQPPASPRSTREPVPEARASEPLCGTCRSPLATSLDRLTLPVGSGKAKSSVHAEVFYCTVCGTALNVERA